MAAVSEISEREKKKKEKTTYCHYYIKLDVGFRIIRT
jgi:hypothetical protein